MPPNDRRSLKLALIVAVASGQSVRSAAIEKGIPLTTAKRWTRSDWFRRAVDQARGRLLDKAVGRLVKVADKSIGTLEKLLGDRTEDAVRLRAASTLLGRLIDISNHADVIKRIEALEQSARGGGGTL